MAFVKTGNLAMVSGLVNYHRLGRGVVLIRGSPTDEIKVNGEKVSTAQWNPLLVAIANKKLDIVKYFLEELSISISLFGLNPSVQGSDAYFALQLALSNQDLPMLTELWGGAQYQTWTSQHLQWLVKQLVDSKWNAGLAAILKASPAGAVTFRTTESLFLGMSGAEQIEFTTQVLSYRAGSTPDITKTIEEALSARPFTLVAINCTLVHDDVSATLLSAKTLANIS